jgi:hypothetical protein
MAMRQSRLRSWLVSVAALSVFALALNTSCAQQQEGERCDYNNGISGGDSDCNDGLQCYRAQDLGAGTESDICCPADRTTATVAPCIISSNSLNQDASVPSTDGSTTKDGSTGTDSGSTDSGSTDSGSTDSSSADAADSG